MRFILALGLTLLCIPKTIAGGQASSKGSFWDGQFEVFQFTFTDTTAHNSVLNKNFRYRGADLTTYVYKLYQNPDGIAREELTSMSRNRSVEGAIDVKILNYRTGEGIVFNKSGTQAVEGPLRPQVQGKNIGERKILGFLCIGEEFRWQTRQGGIVDLQRWSARGSDFKVPLLEVEYSADKTGALLGMWVRMVSRLEQVDELPASLFEVPLGLHISNVPVLE